MTISAEAPTRSHAKLRSSEAWQPSLATAPLPRRLFASAALGLVGHARDRQGRGPRAGAPSRVAGRASHQRRCGAASRARARRLRRSAARRTHRSASGAIRRQLAARRAARGSFAQHLACHLHRGHQRLPVAPTTIISTAWSRSSGRMARSSRRRTFSRSRSLPPAAPGICQAASNGAPWLWRRTSPPGRADTFQLIALELIGRQRLRHRKCSSRLGMRFAAEAFAPHGERPRNALCRAMRDQRRRFAISEPLPPADEAASANAAGLAARALAASASRRPYLEGLNAEQREAVETLDGPVLVLSGAGTGKTRVLTTRIAHIIATARAYPSQILAVTFTNKAAREMKLRVGLLLGEVAEGMPWLGTFHSIATKMLRRHAELVGLRPDFTILDTDDQIRLLKQVIAAENLDEKRWPARHFAHRHRRLEKPRPHARQGAAGRGHGLRQRQGREALRRLSGAPRDAERRRFRRPPLACHRDFSRASGRARALSRALSLHPRRRVPGHQCGAVSVASPRGAGPQECLLRRRRRPVDLWLARRGSRQHLALRA